MPIQIVKKDKSLQNFNPKKIVDAIRKSADRACVKLTQKQEKAVVDYVCKFLIEHGQEEIEVAKLHNIVENALDEVDPKVAKCYRDYRNYKTNFFAMIDKVYQKKLSLSFIADRSNANADSALVTTQKAIVYNELNTEFYKKFFLNEAERKASDEGFIYIHDKNARLDTLNCCIYNMEGLMKGGFKMGNLEYGEPKTLDVAFDLMCDVAMNAASAQYGGFTIPEVDKLLGYYAEKSYNRYLDEYRHICNDLGVTVDSNKADEYAYNKVKRDVEQGVQGMEMKFNSVASSRGDYPFTAVTFGLGTKRLETLISSTFLKVRKEGQGKEGFKRPVLFPKLSFFYDEELHGEGKELEWLFEDAIDCSSKTMYPDFISLSGEGYAPTMYKKYKTPISRMGCIDYAEKILTGFKKSGSDARELMVGELFKCMKEGQCHNYVSNRVGRIAKNIKDPDDKAKFEKRGYIWYDGELMSQWAKDFRTKHGRKPSRGDVKDFFGYDLHRKSVRESRKIDSSLFNLWDSYLELKTVDILKRNGFTLQSDIELCTNENDFVRNKVFALQFNGKECRKQLDIYFPLRKLGFEVQDFETHSHRDDEPYEHNRKDYVFKKGPSYSAEKSKFFSRLGIRVVELWEDDIKSKNFSEMFNSLGVQLWSCDNEQTDDIPTRIENDSFDVIDLIGEGIARYVKDIDGNYTLITKIIKNKNVTDWIEIELDDNRVLSVTSDHPFITESGQTLACELLVGQALFNEDGEKVFIKSIKNVERCANSYDVETASGTFVFHGIQSHNCRATLAAWYRDGGQCPKDDNDVPIYTGRFNMGAIALNFPMYVAKAKEEGKDFYEVLDYYLELVRGLSQKTIEFLSHKKAGINPLGFCEGGFIGGNKDPEEELGREFLKPMTISFGMIALNEASVLATGKSIAEDDTWAFEVMQYINKYVDRIKKEDDTLYAIYGVPGETAVCTLRDCFVKKYGIIKGVSDKPYFTNSFHCAVYEDITPIHKQDSEYRCFHLTNGGNIQYCRYPVGYNKDAIRALVKRAMEKGYYEGVNMELNFCNECGHQWVDGDICPKCGTDNIVQIQRMNGYLGYSKIGKDKSYFHEGKMVEFKDRISM